MIKKLTKIKREICYFENDKKIVGVHKNIRGDVTWLSGDVTGLSGNVTGLRGNVTGLSGDVTGLRGDVTWLSGDVTGLSGDVTGISGDVTECEITETDRLAGIKIEDLIEEEKMEALK